MTPGDACTATPGDACTATLTERGSCLVMSQHHAEVLRAGIAAWATAAADMSVSLRWEKTLVESVMPML